MVISIAENLAFALIEIGAKGLQKRWGTDQRQKRLQELAILAFDEVLKPVTELLDTIEKELDGLIQNQKTCNALLNIALVNESTLFDEEWKILENYALEIPTRKVLKHFIHVFNQRVMDDVLKDDSPLFNTVTTKQLEIIRKQINLLPTDITSEVMNQLLPAIEHLLQKQSQTDDKTVSPFAIAYNAKSLPDAYIERPQYFDVLKEQLTTTDTVKNNQVLGITSLQGIGGIGKTTIAIALCNDNNVRLEFDQIFFLDVGKTINKENVHSLMQLIGQHHFKDDASLYQTLQGARLRFQDHLKDKRTLIVLDDVWHDGVIEAFNFSSVDCRLLVTTRDKRLVKNAQDIEQLSEDEGLQLLATIFAPDNPQPDKLSDQHRQLIIQLEGHTLAINIAGRWLIENEDTQTIDDYLDLLNSDEATLFDNLQVYGSDKNDNLARSLALTYIRLDKTTQRFFRFLGIIAPNSTLSRQDMIEFWGEQDAPKRIQILLHFGLLTTLTDDDGNKLQQYEWKHPLIRAYARKLLEEMDEFDNTFATYVHWITSKAQFYTVPMERWDSELGSYYLHIDFVGNSLVELWKDKSKQDTIIDLAGEFVWQSLYYIGYRPEVHKDGKDIMLRGMAWLEMAEDIYRNQDNKYRQAGIIHDIGFAWTNLSNNQKALYFCNKALPLRREANDREGEARTLGVIGNIWGNLGDQYKALEFFNQSLSIQKKIGDKQGEATILNSIGNTWFHLGDNDKALKFCNQALIINQDIGYKRGEAQSVGSIGRIWFRLEDQYKALKFFNQALSIQRKIGDKQGEASTLNNIGHAWANLGNQHKALDFYNQALPLRRNVGNKAGEATTLNNIGRAWQELDDYRKALNFYNESLNIQRKVSDKVGEAITLNNIGSVWLKLEDKPKALIFYEQALEIFQEILAWHYVIALKANIAILHAKQKKWIEAINRMQKAIVIMRKHTIERSANGRSLQDLNQMLAEFYEQRDGRFIKPSVSPDNIMTIAKEAYNKGGKKAVRQALEGYPDAMVEQILGMLQGK